MNAQQFLGEFGHIANAPLGVARLRALILDLAIRGELTSTPFTASSADALLAEIQQFRRKQIEEGKLRRPTPLPEIEASELSFQVPENWLFERLGNLCEIVRGVTFPSSKKLTSASASSVVCLRTTNVQTEVDWSDLIYIDKDLVGRDDQWLEQGDTLISMANSYELVGKVALVRHVKERTTFGGFIAAIRPHVLEPEFLYLLLRSPYMQGRMRVTASQTTNIANISLGGMRPIPTPIPPKEEQSRIVAKVDELMALCDQLEAQQQQRRSLQNKLRQSALQAVASATSPYELQTTWARLADNFGQLFDAPRDVDDFKNLILELGVHGLLVRQNLSESPAIELLKDVDAERRQMVVAKKIKAAVALPSLQASDLPYKLPVGWIWARVIDIVEVGTGSTPPKSAPEYYGGNVPWYTSSATNHKFARASETRITEKALRETNCKIFPAGSLIVAMYGQGKTRGQVSELVIPGATNQAVAALVFFDSSLGTKAFLKYFFEKIYKEIRLTAEGGPQPNLNVGKIKETLIPVPPIAEQLRIVAKLDQLMSLCNQLEEQIRASSKIAERLVISTIATITGINVNPEKEAPLKAPQNELVAPLRLGQTPNRDDHAPLATLLTQNKGELFAGDLCNRFGQEIDAFYAQLKQEVAHGWIQQPEMAEMREKAAV